MASAICSRYSLRLPRRSLLPYHYRSTPLQPLHQALCTINPTTHPTLDYNKLDFRNLHTRNDLEFTEANTKACMQELRAQTKCLQNRVGALRDVRDLQTSLAVMKERRELNKDMRGLVFATGVAVASGTFMLLHIVSGGSE